MRCKADIIFHIGGSIGYKKVGGKRFILSDANISS